MATIVTRAGKGSPLTNTEVDANFTNLNTDKAELSGAAFTGAITTNSTVDGRDVATDGTKLDTVETNADVTDATNVTAAGALMDSELTAIASVKALDQGVATTDSPTFAAATVTGTASATSVTSAQHLTAGSAYSVLFGDGGERISGNNSSSLLNFFTGATERMRIDATGVDVTGVVDVNTGSGTSPSYFNSFLNVQNNASTSSSSSLTITAGNAGYAGLHFGDAENGRIGQVAYSNADNALLFTANNTERMRIDASGNLLVGVTATTLSGGSLTLPNSGIIAFHDAGGNARNTLQFVSGELKHGAAGGGLTSQTFFTSAAERMRIDSSGNVGIGMTPAKLLDLQATDNLAMRFYKSTSFKAGIEVATTSGDMITSSAVDDLAIRSQTNMLFSTGGATERMRIDSSGNLLVGKSASSFSTDGSELRSNGAIWSTVTGQGAGSFNIKGTDGVIVDFYKDGTAIGSISTWGGNPAFGRSNCALLFNDDNNRIIPASVQSNGARDNVIDLGDPSHRFNDVWIGGGIHLGGTGAANKLDDYEEGTWTPVGVNMTVASVVYARYVKVGRQVHVDAWVNITSGSGSGSRAALSGLPFVSTSYCTGVTNSSASNATINNSHCRSLAGGSNVQFCKDNDTVVNAFDIDAGHILFSITYQIA